MTEPTNGGGREAPTLVSVYLNRHSGRTHANLAGYLSRWLAWCAQAGIAWQEATADDIQAWGASLADQGLASRSVGTALSAARGLYHWLWAAGHRADDASARVTLPRRERSAARAWLGRGDLRSLLAAARRADGDTALAVHLWALSGLRLGEALRADVADLSRHEGRASLAVQRSKRTGRDRLVLPLATARLAQECAGDRVRGPLLRLHGGGRMTAGIARRRLAALCREAQVPQVTPQGLRVGWITLALQAGIPEREVSISAGHASSAMTAQYDAARCLVERAVGQQLAEWLETRD